MTYKVTTEADAIAFEEATFREHCRLRGVDSAAVLRGEATLDLLNGAPVLPPVTTHFVDIALNADQSVVYVNPPVEAFDGATLTDASGDPYVVDLSDAVPYDELTEAQQQAILKAAKANAESKPPVKPSAVVADDVAVAEAAIAEGDLK